MEKEEEKLHGMICPAIVELDDMEEMNGEEEVQREAEERGEERGERVC